MAQPINIIVTSTDKTAAGFKSVMGGMKGIGESARGTLTKGLKIAAGAFAGLGVAGAASVAGIGAAITKMTLDAAQVEGVKNTFESLASSINAEAEPAMQAMREATRGMVADADLMQAGNKFMAMGLAESQEEMAKLSEIATQLGSAMGEGPTESMENFALMLANQSIPRLDSFGISSGKVRERIEELRAANAGMTRETAFMQAVMEQAEVTMAKVGEQGKSSASSIARIQSTVENVSLGIGQKFIPILKDMLAPIADLVQDVGPKLIEWAGSLAEWLGPRLTTVIEKITGFLGGFVNELGRAFGLLQDGRGPLVAFVELFDQLFPEEVGNRLFGFAAGLQALLKGGGAWDFPWEDVFPPWLADTLYTVTGILGDVQEAISQFVGELQAGHSIVSATWEAIASFAPEETATKVAELVGSIREFVTMVADKVGDLVSWKDVLIALGVGIASIVLPAVVSLVASIGALVAPILLVIGAVALLRKAWESDFLGIQGIVSNLVSQIGPFIASVVEWFQNALPVALAAAKGAFEVLGNIYRTVIAPALSGLGDAFKELFGALKSAWQEIAPIFAELGKTFADAFGLGGGEAIKFADVMRVAVQAIIIPVKVLTAVVTVAAKVIGAAARLIGKAWDKHGGTITKVLGFILKGFQKSFGQIFKVVDKFVKLVGKIWNKWFGNSVILDQTYKFGQGLVRAFISFFAGVIDELAKWARDFLSRLSKALDEALANVIAWAKETLAKFVALFVDIVRETVQGMAKFVSELARGLASALAEFVSWAKETLAEIIAFFVDLVRETVQGIAKFVSEIAKGLASALDEFVDWASETLGEIISFFVDLVREAVQGLARFVSEITSGLASALAEFTSWISETLSSIASFFSDLAQDAVEGMADFVSKIISGLGDALQEFIDWGGDILDSVGESLRNIISAVETWASELYQTFKTALEALAAVPGEIAELLRGIGQEIIEFVIAGVQSVQTFVSDLVAQFSQWFTDFIGKIRSHSIAEIMESGIEVIKEFVLGLLDKVGGDDHPILTALKGLVTGAADALKKAVPSISDLAQAGIDIVQKIITGVTSMAGAFWNALVGVINDALEGIFGIRPFPEARDAGASIAGALADGINQDAYKVAQAAVNAVNDAYAAAAKAAGAQSPSSLFSNLGEDLMAGLSQGITRGMPTVNALTAQAVAVPGTTINYGGQTFSPTINNQMDEEEFFYRVQEALRQMES